MKIPTKWAMKNKNMWLGDCLGLIKWRMSLCIPYAAAINDKNSTNPYILFKVKMVV